MSEKERYCGYKQVTDEELAKYFEGKVDGLIQNQYLYIDKEGPIYYFNGNEIKEAYLEKPKSKKDVFIPKNFEQKMAFHLMENRNVPIKVLIGVAGAGKTKLGLNFGLRALDSGEVKKLFIVRQPSPVGEEIGFLKGTKEEKLSAWFNPIFDNLDDSWSIQERIARKDIEFEAPAFMQGRDLQETFVLVDEAQLLTVEQVKMLGSRIGEGSTIVFAGDYDQIFNKKYAGDKNGLLKLVETFAGIPEFGVVHMTQSVRGRVAELFATKM
jgi:Predicted ATPase related to phosphate starvation-inducible protein PhoH